MAAIRAFPYFTYAFGMNLYIAENVNVTINANNVHEMNVFNIPKDSGSSPIDCSRWEYIMFPEKNTIITKGAIMSIARM